MNQSIIKKISSGYYQGNYKGVNYTICKVDLTNENSWYWQINNETVNDHHSSKKIAILAVEEWIDDTYDVNTLQKLQKEQETQEIKRLFKLSEIAQAKVEFNHNGTKVVNPMQQAAATRIYSKAYKLCMDKGYNTKDVIAIHREVINEINQ